MVKAAIVGGTGYTGVELLRLLAQHPQVELAAITSRRESGTAVATMFPSLRGRVGLAFSDPANAGLEQCDVVFFATPNAVAMGEARAYANYILEKVWKPKLAELRAKEKDPKKLRELTYDMASDRVLTETGPGGRTWIMSRSLS